MIKNFICNLKYANKCIVLAIVILIIVTIVTCHPGAIAGAIILVPYHVVKSCNSFEDQAPVDEIFIWVAGSWFIDRAPGQ